MYKLCPGTPAHTWTRVRAHEWSGQVAVGTRCSGDPPLNPALPVLPWSLHSPRLRPEPSPSLPSRGRLPPWAGLWCPFLPLAGMPSPARQLLAVPNPFQGFQESLFYIYRFFFFFKSTVNKGLGGAWAGLLFLVGSDLAGLSQGHVTPTRGRCLPLRWGVPLPWSLAASRNSPGSCGPLGRNCRGAPSLPRGCGQETPQGRHQRHLSPPRRLLSWGPRLCSESRPSPPSVLPALGLSGPGFSCHRGRL